MSPLNSCNSSIFSCESVTTELSSLTASSTISLLGFAFERKIAVAKSSLQKQNASHGEKKKSYQNSLYKYNISTLICPMKIIDSKPMAYCGSGALISAILVGFNLYSQV